MKIKAGMVAEQAGKYRCTRCGYILTLAKGDTVPRCPKCGNTEFEFIG